MFPHLKLSNVAQFLQMLINHDMQVRILVKMEIL